MYTQCPECDTIFRVNAAVLRAAQGQVRCGVCDATFDAVRFLMDEIEAGVNAASASGIHFDPLPDEPPSTGETAEKQPPFQPSPSLPLVAFDVADAANEWWATPVSEWVAPPTPAAIEVTTDETPAMDADEDRHADVDTEFHIAAPTTSEIASEPEPEPAHEPIAAFETLETPRIELEDQDRVGRSLASNHPASAGRWLACAVLLLGLLAQVVDHERDRLATVATIAPALTAVYGLIGRSIEPRWDIAAYDIREWTATPDTSSKTIQLRAKIRNRADRAQPWPLLRIIFEDRYGGLVARRDFTPSEYLPGHPPDSGLMGTGMQIEANLALVDPGSQVVSYEIDTCLPRGGEVGCGSDYKGTHAE
jgi:predicted Zn finger-like uncharacterized protein